MNSLIQSLHGRDALDSLRSFEKLRVRLVKKIAKLKFLKNCRDDKIIPKFAVIKHALKDRNRRIFEDTSAAIIRSEIR